MMQHWQNENLLLKQGGLEKREQKVAVTLSVLC